MIKLPKTISENEFLTILKTIQNKKSKIAFMLGFYECMRISEVINLKPEDIDTERGFIHIKQAKGKKDRDIPIMEIVKKGLKHIPIGIGIRGLQKRFNKHFPEGLTFHSLRHSGASYYLNDKKVGIRSLQQLLGHSRLDTTQIYTHISPKQLQEDFENLW